MANAEDDAAQAASMVALLWGERPVPTRGPKRSLSVEQIADVAVAVADELGLDAVSMQRVADELDVTKMSLYRYLGGKSELVAVMIERAVGDPPDLAQAPDWRRRLERWVRLMSATWDAHPWLPWATVGARVVGPREAGWTEAAVAAMQDTALSSQQCMDVVSTVSGLLRNTQSGLVTGTQPWHDRELVALIRQHADRFPSLSHVVSARPRSPRQAREFGLRCLLDGVEKHIDGLGTASGSLGSDAVATPNEVSRAVTAPPPRPR